jgi:hypothetical protein
LSGVGPATIAFGWTLPSDWKAKLKMNFESTDVVCITSDEGDALVPGTEARAVAEQEANASGKSVTIRNPVTDEVLATIRPASESVSRTLALDVVMARCEGLAMSGFGWIWWRCSLARTLVEPAGT